MKKFVALFVAVIIMSSQAIAAPLSVEIDGEKVEFNSQQPIIQNDRTLIPLRGVFEKLGYSVDWNANTKTAVLSKDENTIEVTAGANSLLINGSVEKALDVPASILNGSMMLPLRAIGEAGGLIVDWDSNTKTASISSEADISTADPQKIKSTVNLEYVICVINTMIGTGNQEDNNNGIYAAYKYAAKDDSIGAYTEISKKVIESKKKYIGIAEEINCRAENKFIIDNYVETLNLLIDFHNHRLDYYLPLFSRYSNNEVSSAEYDKANKQYSEEDKALDKALDEHNKFFRENAESFNKGGLRDRYSAKKIETGNLTPEQTNEINKYLEDMSNTVNESMKLLLVGNELTDDSALYKKAADKIRDKINSIQMPLLCAYDKEALLCACDCLEDVGEILKAEVGDATEIPDEAYIKMKSSLNAAETFFSRAFPESYTPLSKFMNS